MPRPTGLRRHAVPLAMLVGALLGWFLAPSILAPLSSAQQLDTSRWTVIVPGRDEGLAGVVDTGTGTVGSALVLGTQSFGRRDTVSPRGLAPAASATIDLADWSAPMQVDIRTTRGELCRIAVLEPGGWRSLDGVFHAVDGPVELGVVDGRSVVQGTPIGPAAPGTWEFSSTGGESGFQRAAIEALQLRDSQGLVLLDERFDDASIDPVLRGLVAVAVSLVATALAVLGTASTLGGVGGGLLLVPPVAVLALPLTAWQAICMRLYITQGDLGQARGTLVAALLLPLFGAALVASGVLRLRKGRRKVPWAAALAVVLVVGAVASRELQGLEIALGVLATAVLAVPIWTARSSGQPVDAVMARDLPALLAVALGAWSLGLLPALVWRVSTLLSDVRWFNQNAPAAGVNALLVTALALPLALELGLRGTELPGVWATARQQADASLDVYWDEDCGQDPQPIYYFGGSSTGGAYQFAAEPEAFFAGVLHEKLCDAGHAVHSLNLGDSGRDSWDAANGAEALYADLPPAVAVVYLGVNDLLTEHHPLTKRERREQAQGGVGSPSESINGFALLLRQRALHGVAVVAVPIEDAEVNLRALIALTTGAGGEVLLVPEYARTGTGDALVPYRDLERKLADEDPAVHIVDPYFLPPASQEIMADRNHLTRAGHVWLAEALQPTIEGALR